MSENKQKLANQINLMQVTLHNRCYQHTTVLTLKNNKMSLK
jgi:hypothetical protein